MKRLLGFGTFFYSVLCFATTSTFHIIPNAPLPETFPKFGMVSAYYLVTNTTDQTLEGNFVKNLPSNVSQVTCEPTYCGEKFNLGPHGSPQDSCILKLTIRGTVDPDDKNPLLVCNADQSKCDAASLPLCVKEGSPVPFMGVVAGGYANNTGAFLPLLAHSQDSGNSWHYPRGILDNLQASIHPDFSAGLFRAAGCSGSTDKSVCVAAGFFCTDSSCVGELPLVAIGRHNGALWAYPNSIWTHMQTRVHPDFQRGFLTGASCTGSGNRAFCIASGVYTTSNGQMPMIATSPNGGGNWEYPASASQNLTTAIDPSFNGGFLLNASCNQSSCESRCIAPGAFCSGAPCDKQLPLLAVSADRGNTWSYPAAIFQNLTTLIDPEYRAAELRGSSCTGKGAETICIAAGHYYNQVKTYPLLVQTRDGGATWRYPTEIFQDLENKLSTQFEYGHFNAAACTGGNNTARCIAVGTFSTGASSYPLLALTKDSGQTWSYPSFIYTKLKTLVDPNARHGLFESATCIGKAKDSICMAAGNYCVDRFCNQSFPLIAKTKDGGKTWSYPSSIFQNLTTVIDPNYIRGILTGISCSGSAPYSFCVASGQYSTDTATYPLVAYSVDNGDTWFYPASIYQNLTTTIHANFIVGFFNKAASTGGKLKSLVADVYSLCPVKFH